MNSFLIMLMFFTRINIKKELNFSEKEFKKGIVKIPIIGVIIGVILYFCFLIMDKIGIDRLISSVIIYSVYIIMTGGLHIDGLADTVDGIYSNREKERIMEIMKDSNIGTFGVLAIFILSFINISAISNLDSKYLLVFPVFSRVLIILVAFIHDYARKDGMGKLFIDSASLKDFLVTGAVLSIAVIYFLGMAGLAGFAVSGAFTLIWIKKISRKIDGITGDVLGFSIEVSQCIFLISSYIATSLIKLI